MLSYSFSTVDALRSLASILEEIQNQRGDGSPFTVNLAEVVSNFINILHTACPVSQTYDKLCLIGMNSSVLHFGLKARS